MTKNKIPEMIEFGENLRKLRVNQNMTAYTLAEKVKVSENYIGEIERAVKWPSLRLVVDLANLFQVRISDLLGETEKIHTSKSQEKNDFLNELTHDELLVCIDGLKAMKESFELIKIRNDEESKQQQKE